MKLIVRSIIVALLLLSCALAGTHITGVLDNADRTSQSGYILISWTTSIASDSAVIGANQIKVNVVGGIVDVTLEPGLYTVEYHAGTVRKEKWIVTASSTTVSLSSVITAVLPNPLPMLPPSQISPAGATTGQALCWLGATWGPGDCGGTASSMAWSAITGVPTLTNTVFGRSGTVTAQSGDYTTSLVPEGSNLYFTTARAQAAMAGLYQTPITSGTSSQYFKGDLSLGTFPSTWPWSSLTGVPSFATVATSGSYADLSNKPTIPAAQVNSDWNASSGFAQVLNKPSTWSWGSLTGVPSFATVATSGSYTDLSNKPTIPAAQVNSDWNAPSGLAQVLNKPTTWAWASLSGVPSTFAPSAHTHAASDVTSGTFSIGLIPTGTSGTTVALGNHLHTGVYQPVITTGTTLQYFRGDLSLATFPTTWAWGSLTGVPSLTNTVFGRSGTVTAQSGDYTTSQVTEGTNLYFTNARAQSAMSGLYQTPLTTYSTISALTGYPAFATVSTSGSYADLSSKPTLAASVSAVSHQWLNAYNSATGAFSQTQPACGDLSNAAASCSTDATNASNIASGTLGTARLPVAQTTRTASITDIAPATGDSGQILVLNPATAITLTRVYCASQGGTNVVINLDKRAEGTIGTDSGAHLISDLTAVNTGASTTTWANGSAQCGGTASCAIAAHVPVVMTITSVSGTVNALNCSVDYTVN